MYKIYFNGNAASSVYVPKTILVDPIVKLQEGKAGTFDFTMLPDHPYYDSVSIRSTTVEVYTLVDGVEDTEPFFSGFVSDITIDFYKRKIVYCEGDLSYFNDTIQPQKKYEGKNAKERLVAYINQHNTQAVTDDNRDALFFEGICEGDGTTRTHYTNYKTTMQEITDDIVDDIPKSYPHVRYDKAHNKRVLDILVNPIGTSSQVIQIGRNLLDYSRNYSAEDICTAIIPRGARLEDTEGESSELDKRLDVSSVNGGSVIVTLKDPNDSSKPHPAMIQYGFICKVVVWDDVTTASALLSKAQDYLRSHQYDELDLELTAVDLGMTDTGIDCFKLSESIRVVSEPHGLDQYYRLTKLERHLNDPSQDKITLGDTPSYYFTGRVNKKIKGINNVGIATGTTDLPPMEGGDF